jgi:hypothetical protein
MELHPTAVKTRLEVNKGTYSKGGGSGGGRGRGGWNGNRDNSIKFFEGKIADLEGRRDSGRKNGLDGFVAT